MLRTSMLLAALVGLAFVAAPAEAGKFNKKLSIGDAAPTFADLPTAEGKKVSLADMKDKDVVVVAITCNHCPVAVAYEDRIIELTKKYSANSKVGVVAINVNTGDSDKLDKMTERAKAKGFNFPYAYDETQKIGRELGATRTPEFFVFHKGKVAYMGALDDNMKASTVKKKYVEDAVEALLAGKSVETPETRPSGCGVQYNK